MLIWLLLQPLLGMLFLQLPVSMLVLGNEAGSTATDGQDVNGAGNTRTGAAWNDPSTAATGNRNKALPTVSIGAPGNDPGTGTGNASKASY